MKSYRDLRQAAMFWQISWWNTQELCVKRGIMVGGIVSGKLMLCHKVNQTVAFSEFCIFLVLKTV